MISMTYHVDNNLTELRVPLKTWERTNYDGNRGAYKRLFQVPHIELDAILKYSPYACEEDLLKQFERIAKEKKGVARTVGTGTKVIINNLHKALHTRHQDGAASSQPSFPQPHSRRHLRRHPNPLSPPSIDAGFIL